MRSSWPPRREPPPAPSTSTPKLWRKQADLPTAIVKSTGYLAHNTGRAVLRVSANRRWEFAMVSFALSIVTVIPLAVKGYGGLALAAMFATWIGGFVTGKLVRRESCSDPDCGVKLPPGVEHCPRCAGHIAGALLLGENRLAAEERLGINQDDYDIDVGESEDSARLPGARVRRAGRNARIDENITDTRIG